MAIVNTNWKKAKRLPAVLNGHTPYCIGKEPVEIRKLWIDDLNKTISLPTTTPAPQTSIITTLPPVPTPSETTTPS
ncbi:hypothetical protein OSTOST_09344, partial [Ostertagia ostertagi]